MPVLPHRTHPFQDRKELYQFLSACQQKSIEKNRSYIASLALDIDPIDPLVALHELYQADQPHFYFEKRQGGEAIAAINAAKLITTSGSQRFSVAQDFVHHCSTLLNSHNLSNYSSTNPRFFCSFTFFDQPQSEQSPFPGATVFLPQWQIIRQGDRCEVTANLVIHAQQNIRDLADEVWQQLRLIRLSKYGIFNLSSELREQLNHRTTVATHNFKSAVSSVLKLIRQNQFDKLVLAHAVDVISHFPFQWAHSLHNLRQLHPDCYVFSTSSGGGASFIGASPERLLSIQHGDLMTDALAGSAPRGKTVAEDTDLAHQLLQSAKERHEHQVVVDFIVQQLHRLGLSPQLALVPNLLQLSNIQHIHTPIRAVMPPSLHPLKLLSELHPTPAVAGMPRELACQQIRNYETFERSLYAAPLGWVDAQGNAEFVVGIRSALISGDRARLYAGAGIVAGSNPGKEFAEVQLKLQTLLRALV